MTQNDRILTVQGGFSYPYTVAFTLKLLQTYALFTCTIHCFSSYGTSHWHRCYPPVKYKSNILRSLVVLLQQ